MEGGEGRTVSRSAVLGLPRTLVVGSYGGGDAFRAAEQVLVVDLGHLPDDLPLVRDSQQQQQRSLKEVVWDDVVRAYETQARVRPEERIVQWPSVVPRTKEEIRSWTLRVQISRRLAATDVRYNLFYQGWLFADEVEEEGRQGISRWPLIGLYDPVNLTWGDEQTEEDVANVGINCLKPADQHAHLVHEVLELDGYKCELNDWHLGSDMARFRVDDEVNEMSMAWAVCVDLDKQCCEVTLLLLVSSTWTVRAKSAISGGNVSLEGLFETTTSGPLTSKDYAVALLRNALSTVSVGQSL